MVKQSFAFIDPKIMLYLATLVLLYFFKLSSFKIHKVLMFFIIARCSA